MPHTTTKTLLTIALIFAPLPALAQSDTSSTPATTSTDTNGTTTTTQNNKPDYGWLGLLGLAGLAGLRRQPPTVVVPDRNTTSRV